MKKKHKENETKNEQTNNSVNERFLWKTFLFFLFFFIQGEVLINGVAHIVGDIPASNGLVHVIDQMIPVSKSHIYL